MKSFTSFIEKPVAPEQIDEGVKVMSDKKHFWVDAVQELGTQDIIYSDRDKKNPLWIADSGPHSGHAVPAVEALKLDKEFIDTLGIIRKMKGVKITQDAPMDPAHGEVNYVYYNGKPLAAVSFTTEAVFVEDHGKRFNAASIKVAVDGRGPLSSRSGGDLQRIGIKDWQLKDVSKKEAVEFIEKLIAAV